MSHFLYTIIIYPLYALIECIFSLFSKITGNTGISVIGVSIGVTLFCLPLYAVAEKLQEAERKKQKSMQPMLERIKASFTGDERYMMTTAYYKECRYNPVMALRSIFGLLIQIPFFIAAYTFLSHLPSLKGASFLFIKDMGAQDALFKIGSFPVNVLPIAMTLINIVSGIIYTKGLMLKDKIQVFVTALVFLVILYPSPAGLVLYWTMNNVFSMVKNIFYKLKNPLKVFWICTCVGAVLSAVYILFVFSSKMQYKVVFLLGAVLIIFLPQVVKAVKKLLDGTLSCIVENAKVRHTLYLVSCGVLFLLSGTVIPSSLIASSPAEFAGIGEHANPLYFIGNTGLQAAGIFLFWAPCVYFLFGKKVQTVLAFVMTAFVYCALANSYIFMLSYGDVSSSLSFLNATDFKVISFFSLVNVFVLIALFCALPFFIKLRNAKVLISLSSIFALALGAVSIANIFSISKAYSDYKKAGNAQTSASIEPIFHLSKNHQNVVLFMFDRAQSQYIDEMFKEDPSLYEKYSGFVFYNNVVSFNGHTLQGAPGLYGGYEYTPLEMNRRADVPLVKKNNEALLMLPRIFTEQKGFSAAITDPSWGNYAGFCDLSFISPFPKINGYQTIGRYSALWKKEHWTEGGIGDDGKILERNLLFFSFFRQSPIALRQMLYKKGTYWSSDSESGNVKIVIDNYSALDYLKQLTSISDTENGSYVCMVNELTHENLLLQAPDYIPVKKVTNKGTSKYKENLDYHTQIAALKMLGSWLDFLKENGIYDNTRIVIVSDHGCNGYEDDIEPDAELDSQIAGGKYEGRGHYHPLLLFKDFNAAGKLTEDDTFMTNTDTPSLLLKGLVENPVNPFTGKIVPLDTHALKKDGVIISISDRHQPAMNGKYKFNIPYSHWWKVKDNIFKASSWSRPTEKEIQQ